MKNDSIFPVTRWISAIVVLALVITFIVLFLMPDRTGELFAWAIKPQLSSMFFGAAYLGGAWILLQTAIGKFWHRVHAVFPAVIVFTSTLLVTTILHWDRFSHGNLGFVLWVFLYIVSPPLIFALWIYNRRTDTNAPEASDVVVPAQTRLIARIIGIGVLIFVIASFLSPALLISVWPWDLSPLTARVICGWLSVIGVSTWALSSDSRWTAWRHIFEALSLAALLILIACILKTSELTPGIFNWFTGVLLIAIIGLSSLYLKFEGQRKKASPHL